jgi:hypothetical protein
MAQITGRNNDVMDVEEFSGRGLVDSKSRPSEEVEAVTGDAFIFHAECHLAAAASGGLLYFKNTSDTKEVVVTRIYVDAQVITPTDLIVTQVKAPATVSGGTDISGATDQGKVQKNYGKGKNITGTLVISDGSSDMTFTGGQRYHSIPIKTMTSVSERDMKGTNVIAPNTIILLGWKTVGGGNATNGEIIGISMNCFIRDIT